MHFDLQPTLHGTLIDLRPLRREDFDALLAAANDPLIWEQHPEHDRWTREVFQCYVDGALESGGALAVIDRKGGRIIGSSRYHDLKPHESEVEIGYTFLERAYWGGAYNGELKRLMLEHAFRFVERVVFLIGEDNLRSQKAIQKIGAKLLRRIESHAGMGPHLVFAITRQEFAARGPHV